jgi:hypothetical protein
MVPKIFGLSFRIGDFQDVRTNLRASIEVERKVLGCLECYGHANMQQPKQLQFGFVVNIMAVIFVVLDDDDYNQVTFNQEFNTLEEVRDWECHYYHI